MGTVTDISLARHRRERIEVYHIAESVLPIFQEQFPSDFRGILSITGIQDYGTGVIDERGLALHREHAQNMVDDAALEAAESNSERAWKLHPAVMAAYCILLCLEPVIDLEAIHNKATEAFKYAGKKVK